jgi:hypothetical protein
VRAGELLVQLDAEAPRAAVEEVEQQVAVQGARARRVAVAASTVIARLKERGLATLKEFDQAKFDLDQAQVELQRVAATRREVGARLRDSTLVAPVSGVVLARPVDVGQVVSASLGHLRDRAAGRRRGRGGRRRAVSRRGARRPEGRGARRGPRAADPGDALLRIFQGRPAHRRREGAPATRRAGRRPALGAHGRREPDRSSVATRRSPWRAARSSAAIARRACSSSRTASSRSAGAVPGVAERTRDRAGRPRCRREADLAAAPRPGRPARRTDYGRRRRCRAVPGPAAPTPARRCEGDAAMRFDLKVALRYLLSNRLQSALLVGGRRDRGDGVHVQCGADQRARRVPDPARRRQLVARDDRAREARARGRARRDGRRAARGLAARARAARADQAVAHRRAGDRHRCRA